MTTSNFKSYIIILSAVLVALIVNPYSYGHSNHGQEIPPILSLLDQNLFLKDFAIQSYLEINPRYFWQLLIYYMQDIFDLSIPGSLLLILLFSSTSFFAAIFFISKILLKTNVNSGKDLSQLFLIFSYVSIMAMLPLLSWGSKIFYFEAIPSTLGMGVAIWSFYFALQEKWMPAYLICSISIFFHFIIGGCC